MGEYTKAMITKKDFASLATKKDLKMSENRVVNKIVKKLNIVAEYFDKETMDLKRRTERLEKHTGLVNL
jgi:hypothetical protein